MHFFLRFFLKFSISFVLTLFIITALLYAVVMITPAETRATLYMPRNTSPRMTEEQYQKLIDMNIERYKLNAPYPVQYFNWVKNLAQGNWGYSPTLQDDVLKNILLRTPATVELTIISLLIYMPLGLLCGVLAGSNKYKVVDRAFRLTAFVATSLPPFILAIILMVIFYINLHWFLPGRSGYFVDSIINSGEFKVYTGMLILDGLFNGRFDVSLDALRHIAMPALTLAAAQWAVIGRLTRIMIIEEQHKDYVIAARSRGLTEQQITWRHALKNAIPPIFTSSVLSAASLLTSVFVVEIIFHYPGISSIALKSMAYVPDAPAALGFGIYSVIIVLILMGILDFIQSIIDPRIRESLLK